MILVGAVSAGIVEQPVAKLVFLVDLFQSLNLTNVVLCRVSTIVDTPYPS